MIHHNATAGEGVNGRPLTIEGHRDCYEQIYWHNMGEENPIVERLLPRLNVGKVDIVVYAIGGDTLAHSSGRDKKLLVTLENIVDLRRMCDQSEGRASIAYTAEDICLGEEGHVKFVLHLEGGSPLEGSLASLDILHELGLRSMQPTWNVRNELGDGVREQGAGGGLTRFGKAVIRRMGELNMMLDLSHISEAGFWNAMHCAEGPVVATHSNSLQVYEQPRNLTDDQIRAVAESGGTVGLHSLPTYVGPGTPTLEDLIPHAQHIAELVGTQYISIGTDFVLEDGPRPGKEALFHDPRAEPPVLEGLTEAHELPNLAAALGDGGFSDAEVAGVMGENLARVLRTVLGQPVQTARS